LSQGRIVPAKEQDANVEALPGVEHGLRVLVVDDNSDAAELLADALRALGHDLRVAFDGPGALRAATEFEPDVALLDLGLPAMDGYEVARSLRSLPQTQNIELVAVTGYGQEADRRRTQEAGFGEHMVKPVDLDRLRDWLARKQAQGAAARALQVAPCNAAGSSDTSDFPE
jgi:CheY-like chemotaxis protein